MYIYIYMYICIYLYTFRVILMILWMEEIRSHHEMKPWLKSVVGVCRGIIIPKLLRWRDMDFVHPQ